MSTYASSISTMSTRILSLNYSSIYETSFSKSFHSHFPASFSQKKVNIKVNSSSSYSGNDRNRQYKSSGRHSNKPSAFLQGTKDFYGVLGLKPGAGPIEIRQAYRKLQKQYHPDVAGPEMHDFVLLLNEAYDTLMDDKRRSSYEKERIKAEMAGFRDFTGQPLSKWNGPDWSQGVFVDEAACVGCQECYSAAPNTFTMDANCGKARVKVQWGDSESRIKTAAESCPVNCIHYVEKEDIPVLEYLMQPKLRRESGVYGGGYDQPFKKPGAIFAAAQNFRRKMKAQESEYKSPEMKETQAQRAAREEADKKMRSFLYRMWTWNNHSQSEHSHSKNRSQSQKRNNGGFPWLKLFGFSATSELFSCKILPSDVQQVIVFVQDWALMWASSSEIPLPLPFKVDILTNGVELTFLTMSAGSLTSVGSLVMTVEAIDSSEPSEVETMALGGMAEPYDSEKAEAWVLNVKRVGSANDKPMPGEKRVIQNFKDAICHRGESARGYESYHIPRHHRV